MPREIIPVVCPPYYPKVGWRQDGDVQLGVELEGERSLFWQFFHADKTAELGTRVLDLYDEHRQVPTDREQELGKVIEALLRSAMGLAPEEETATAIGEAKDALESLRTGRAESDPKLVAEAVLNLLDELCGPQESGRSGYSGLWATLDREGCNRLIRTVRKARDSAFGADA